MLNTEDTLRIAAYCHTHRSNADDIAFQKTVITQTINRCSDVPPQIIVYVDDGICPNTESQTGFQRLLQDVAAGRIDCIAVCHWHHLATSEEDSKLLQRFFRRHEVLVVECRLPPAVLVRIAA